jgi:hypothetical protein
MKTECNISATPGIRSEVYVGQAKDTSSMVHGIAKERDRGEEGIGDPETGKKNVFALMQK